MTRRAVPPPNEIDAGHMRRALDLARRAWGQTSPNPMVGAVLVRDGAVVGEGFHARYGGPHAEAAALAAAGDAARGATAYVTLEPCAHWGKTPPCADALIAAGVARVVCAVADPHPIAAGGAARLRAAGIEVVVGVEQDPARELNAPFFHAVTTSGRPWVTLKLALSIDGAIAPPSSSAPGAGPVWLTGAESRREVHRLRAGADAVAVGLGTVIADDPSLTVRDWDSPRVAPRRVVFDRAARLPLSSALARTAGDVPVTVLADGSALERDGDGAAARVAALRAAGIDVVIASGLADGLRALRESGVRSMLVEGGAGVAAALIDGGAVDRLIIFQAPVLLGAGALGAFSRLPTRAGAAAAPRLRVVERQAFGNDLMTVYALPGSDLCSPD
ncbi:MAG TPA: bifunctional diaminohydroxyphosphoribosylaminopyrimidine deaminase/5-amino-6-(5-phosphoribosylamino)uracil reductase RibD [Gemmatimonadaceae bacterium]|nr:bifunctional diaminohydroxyphosphoribosylaminopyrimidine deaminase/5-amino-6-(5-phosphoribosylamino)uracil reductase RibD [Gemmatimonadaceae bacterium]